MQSESAIGNVLDIFSYRITYFKLMNSTELHEQNPAQGYMPVRDRTPRNAHVHIRAYIIRIATRAELRMAIL